MTALTVSLLTLVAAPFLCGFCARKPSLAHFMDGFVFVAIGGLVLSGILPEAIRNGGWLVLIALALGLLLPVLAERVLHIEGKVHNTVLLLGVTGLFLHAITDGATLALGDDHSGGEHGHEEMLSLGVLLHRLPVGLTIWWLVQPRLGRGPAALILALLGIGTAAGFYLGPHLLEPLSSRHIAFFQAFVTGSLTHVLLHRPHAPQQSCSHQPRQGWSEGIGNLMGGALIVYLIPHHLPPQQLAWLADIGRILIDLSLTSAPALLLGYVLASLIIAFMGQTPIDWMKRGRALQQSARGILVGLPLPVCSCGVLPLYHTLIRRGAPPTAAMAFLIATPELGIDAIILSIPLLGADMTLLRVLAAALVALTVSLLIGRITVPLATTESPPAAGPAGSRPGWREKLAHGLRHGLGELVDHTGPWVVAGLLIAAFAQPLLAGGLFDIIPDHLVVPFFALLGMPVYVCASGATPLVAVLLLNGVSPGAALAFLITGPATNISTIGVLSSLHGRHTALMFGLTTLATAVLIGYVSDALMRDFSPVALMTQQGHGSAIEQLSLACLSLIFLHAILRRGARAFVMELLPQSAAAHSHHV